jgi:hypothetical protein
MPNVPNQVLMANLPFANSAFETSYKDYSRNISSNLTSVLDQFDSDVFDGRFSSSNLELKPNR